MNEIDKAATALQANGFDDFSHDDLRHAAKIVVAALRKPSDEMLKAAGCVRGGVGEEVWQAMIDALLAETEKTDG